MANNRVMTIRTKFIYFVIFTAFVMMEVSLRAEQTIVTPETEGRYEERTPEVEDSQEEELTQEHALAKFSEEIPEVKEAYQTCTGDNPPANSGDLGTCVWAQLDAHPNIQERIINDLKETENTVVDASGEEREGLGVETRDLASAVQTSDSVSRELSNVIRENLHKQLFNDTEGFNVMRDHTYFNDIYKSQLGKNTIDTIADFCMGVMYNRSATTNGNWVSECTGRSTVDANGNTVPGPAVPCPKYPDSVANPNDPSRSLQGEAAIKQNRKINLQALSNITDPNSNLKIKFQNCAMGIANTCSYYNAPQNTSSNPSNGPKSKQDACAVVRYLKNTKQALLEIQKIDNNWEELKDANPNRRGFNAGDVIDPDKLSRDDSNIDDMITIGSGEVDTTEINSANEARRELAEECASDPNRSGCEDFVISVEDRDTMLAEYTIRKQAQFERLKQEIGGGQTGEAVNEDNVRAYLTEEGLTEAEIDQMIEEQTLEGVASDITTRYNSERENLIASLRDRLRQQTQDESSGNPAPVFQTIQGQDRAQEIKEVIHYSNVVSAFFDIQCPPNDPDCGRAGVNTAALSRELESSAFDPQNSTGSTNQIYGSGDQFAGLQELTEGGANNDDTDAKTLDVDTINRLIYGLSDN